MKRLVAVGVVTHPSVRETEVPPDLPWDVDSIKITQTSATIANGQGEPETVTFTTIKAR